MVIRAWSVAELAVGGVMSGVQPKVKKSKNWNVQETDSKILI